MSNSRQIHTTFQRVAVGTALSGRPPHRSQRAELPHWAPTSGGDAQTLFGIRVKNSHRREPAGSQSVHALPSDPVALTPPPEGLEPESIHLVLENAEFALVARHGIVLEISP